MKNETMRLVKPSWKYKIEMSNFIYEMKNDDCLFNAEFPAYQNGDFETLMDKISSGVERETYWISNGGDGILGAVFLRRIDDADKSISAGGNIGYVVRPSARRQGVAFCAVRAVLPILARDMKAAVIGSYETNIGSLRTIEKAASVFGGGMIKKLWAQNDNDPLTRDGVWDIYYSINCGKRR
jgi:predicted acetyltransferase